MGAGILGIGITFAALGDAFRRIININSHVTLSLHVSWISVGISALLGLITILISAYIPARRAARRPAIEAIRQSADIKLKAKTVKTSRLTQWLFVFEGMLASKNFKRSRKKYRAVVFSLFISVVLFISTGEFCHYVLSSVDSTFGGVGYDLRVDILSENLHGEREEQLISQLRAQPEITAAQYITFGYLNTWIAPENLTEDGEDMFRVNETPGTGSVEIIVQAVFMDQNDYAAYAAQLGLGGDGAAGAIVLNRTSYWTGESGNRKIKTFSVLRESLKELTIRRFVPEDGLQYEGSFADETGQIMAVLYNRRTGERKQVLQSELPVSEFPLKLARFTATEPFCTTNVQHGVTMIFPKSRAQEVLAMFGAETSDLSRSLTLQCSDHRAAYRAIAEVLKQNGYSEDLIYNRAESVEADRAMATVIRVFAYGFITLIALIALTNAFNTISTNVRLRRREFAMLRSVGMTRRGLRRAAFFECLLYTAKSLIYGLPVACGVSYLIWLSVNNMWVQEYHLPWGGVLTVTLAVFAVVFITTMYSLHQIEKEEIVEAVKNENL